jgi:hypothetical protein
MKRFFVTFLFTIPLSTAFADYTFLMRDKRYPERPFTALLPSSNREGIKSFESYLVKGSVIPDEEGNPSVGIISGELMQATRNSGHDWDFAFRPSTIEFSDVTMELCDGQFLDVENNPDYWMGTVGRLCPWFTKFLIQEIRRDGRILYHRDEAY